MEKNTNAPKRVEVEISISCQLGLDTVIDNLENILHHMILSHPNHIINAMQLAFDEDDSIVLYHEGTPKELNEKDFRQFTEEMKTFCSQIAQTHPELEISGQFAVEGLSENNAFIYVHSEAGSTTCYTKALSEDMEPGIIFDDPKKKNTHFLDNLELD